jgi:hypothetical protein
VPWGGAGQVQASSVSLRMIDRGGVTTSTSMSKLPVPLGFSKRGEDDEDLYVEEARGLDPAKSSKPRMILGPSPYGFGGGISARIPPPRRID